MLNLLFIGVPWEDPNNRVYTATHSTSKQGFTGFGATQTGLPNVFPFRSSALPDLNKPWHGPSWHPNMNPDGLCCNFDSPVELNVP